jgi:hypothetical protein
VPEGTAAVVRARERLRRVARFGANGAGLLLGGRLRHKQRARDAARGRCPASPCVGGIRARCAPYIIHTASPIITVPAIVTNHS